MRILFHWKTSSKVSHICIWLCSCESKISPLKLTHTIVTLLRCCLFNLQCLAAYVIIAEVLIVVCLRGSSQCIRGRALWQDCWKGLLHWERCQQTHTSDFRCSEVSAWYGHCAQRPEGNAYIFFPYNHTLPF